MLDSDQSPYAIFFAADANPQAVVIAGKARFTLLTDRLLRMEYSNSAKFEDRPSQAFWFRRQPAPRYTLRCDGKEVQGEEGAGDGVTIIGGQVKVIELETEYILLRYRITGGHFTTNTLSVLVKATGATWRYGDLNWKGGNLYGTTRTLDGAQGFLQPEPGLMGRAGWAVVDDSHSLVFNPSGWIEPRQHPENDDLYLFAYGHDYPGCLADFYRVSGPVPLVPRWILGNWWSRYWTYSADELLGLMEAFKAHEVPISVCIVDMDWHLTETGNASSGWTGYTWNRALFPDPPDFLAKLHGLGLRTALNLHPADGVWPHEEQYADFARQMGIDPETKEPVPFDCSDRRFMDNYFKLLHHPYEAMGIDFWWLDWQQGKQTKIPGLDPLWWLNHLHYYDYGRDGKRRPFIFSRWGGLGNHRYPIGFSGDTVVGWDALEFQPPFTATAANVGYGWWSHDIGGHMGGIEDDECYTRWVQYGVFSPILRLHSTNNSFHERRPWRRGPAAEKTASAAMRLRHRLIPYLYSMAWRNHYGGLPLVTPMYYTHPEEESAYQCYQQYWFGSELMVAPFTSPANAETKLSAQHVWFPDGVWFDFFSGQAIPGGRWRTVYGTLDDIPVFARSGAIVPLAPEVGWRGVENPQELHLHIFPGASNRFVLYEDDGATTHYLQGAYALTAFELEWKPDLLCFTIQPAQGDRKVILQQRTYHLYLRGVVQPEAIRLQVNGAPIEANWDYQTQSETLTISPLAIQAGDVLQLEVSAPALTAPRDRSGEILRQWLSGFRLDSWVKQEIAQKWPQVQAGEVSLRSFRKLSDAQRSALESLGEV